MSHTTSLHIGEKFATLAEVDDKKSSLSVTSAAYQEFGFNPYVVINDEFTTKAAQVIQKMSLDAKVRNKDARIIIPDSQSYTRIFDSMPFLSDKELVSAIRFQADQFIPVPIDTVNLDVYIIQKDKSKNKTVILLVAAAKNVIEHASKIAETAGFMPTSVENETSALLSLLTKRNVLLKKTEGMTLTVNFGLSSTSLYLMNTESNLPLQVHNFTIGQSIFYKDIQANVSVAPEVVKDMIERIGFTGGQSQVDIQKILASPFNELISEIQRFILSSKEKSQSNIQHLYLMGEGTRFAGLAEKISEIIKIPVTLLSISDIVQKSTVTDYFTNDWPILDASIGAQLD